MFKVTIPSDIYPQISNQQSIKESNDHLVLDWERFTVIRFLCSDLIGYAQVGGGLNFVSEWLLFKHLSIRRNGIKDRSMVLGTNTETDFIPNKKGKKKKKMPIFWDHHLIG